MAQFDRQADGRPDWVGDAYFALAMQWRLWHHSGPSRGACCRRASRPFETFPAPHTCDHPRPLLLFKDDPMNGREARESGLRLEASVATRRGSFLATNIFQYCGWQKA